MIASPDQRVRTHFCWLATWYLAGLWKFVDNQHVTTLITFVMSVAPPCSLFSTVGQLSRPPVEQQGDAAAVFGITYVDALESGTALP